MFIWTEFLRPNSYLPLYFYHPSFSNKINRHLPKFPKFFHHHAFALLGLSTQNSHSSFLHIQTVLILQDSTQIIYPIHNRCQDNQQEDHDYSQRNINHDPLAHCKLLEHVDRILCSVLTNLRVTNTNGTQTQILFYLAKSTF